MTKVTLRSKSISKGRQSLYLDFYPPIPHPGTGKLTRREFLGLFIYDKAKTSLDKEHNKETKALAENIKAKRQLDVQSQQFGFLNKEKLNKTLISYYEAMANKRTGSNSDNWKSSLYYIKNFFNESVKLSELNTTLCNEYREYLLTTYRQHCSDGTRRPLARNSALSYFNKFKAVLKQAFKEELLTKDLNTKVQGIKPEETQRDFLTLEELQKLYDTECASPVLKKAAIFSAYTGLRFSDIQKLLWSEIHYSKADGHYIQFRQKKTNGTELLHIPDQAIQIIGECNEHTENVFKDLQYSVQNNKLLKDWIKAADICKKITFHCFRHTYATLQLTLGTDLYTLSKLLGHREIKTTQVYTKVVDKLKKEAASKIKLEL